MTNQLSTIFDYLQYILLLEMKRENTDFKSRTKEEISLKTLNASNDKYKKNVQRNIIYRRIINNNM